jgi:hypothetical protein
MNLYFFDIDDTICHTNPVIQAVLQNLDQTQYSKEELTNIINNELDKYGLENLDILNNSIYSYLLYLLKHNKTAVYYITARPSSCRVATVKWLKTHNLWIGDDKLIMDTDGIKGKTINEIMQNHKEAKFAFLFDDLHANHVESSVYKNIIACLPY